MPRFLIEITQETNERALKSMDDAIRMMGSHFVTHADWRSDGKICTGTMIAEIEDETLARSIVPPHMRANAHIYQLEPVGSVH
jgi:hypothetical protein